MCFCAWVSLVSIGEYTKSKGRYGEGEHQQGCHAERERANTQARITELNLTQEREQAAGAQVTSLLKAHILGAADILAAAKAGDQAKVDAAKTKWYANGNDIAAALNSLDPQAFPRQTLLDMMKMHLDLTLQESVDRLQGKYAADIKDYDQVHAEILQMADDLSTGVLQHASNRGGAPSTLPTTGSASPLANIWWLLLFASALITVGGLTWRLALSEEESR